MRNSEAISAGQAADILRVSVRRVQQLIASGELSATKLPGRTGSYVLDRETVEQFRDSRAEGAAS